MNINKNVRMITVATFAALGVMCISTGIAYNRQKPEQNKTVLVVVQKKQVNSTQEMPITLKDIQVEVNTPLSVKILDYLDGTVTDEVLANLKLDTSTVNVTQPGNYPYTITHNKKVYKGNITVIEKPVTTSAIQTITLKALNIKVGTILTNDVSNYIIETVTEGEKALMVLDISQVNSNVAATYQYSITYHNSVYTGTITVTEDQPTLSAQPEKETPPQQVPVTPGAPTVPTTPSTPADPNTTTNVSTNTNIQSQT